MKPHVRIYMQAFGYGEQDYIRCELCAYSRRTARAVDVHHIVLRGMGGRPDADTIDNLIGLCRPCHDLCHGAGRQDYWRGVCQDIVARRKP